MAHIKEYHPAPGICTTLGHLIFATKFLAFFQRDDFFEEFSELPTNKVLQVRCIKVVGSLCLNRTQGCRKTQPEYLFYTNAVIPHKTLQQALARLVTTLDLPSLWYKHGLLPNIHITSLLQFNKHDLCRYFTKPPSFYTQPLSHFSKHC